MFHIETAILLTAILSALVGTVIVYGASSFPEGLRPSVRVWGLAMIGGACAWLLFGAREVAVFSLTIALANVMLVASYATLLWSVCRLLRFETRPWSTFALLAAVFVGSVHYTFVEPNLGLRISVVILAISVLCGAGIAVVWRRAPRPLRPGARIAMASFGVVGALLLLRAALELTGVAPVGQFREATLAHGTLFVLGALGPTASSIGFLMMAYDQVRDELDELASRDSLTGVLRRRTFVAMAAGALSGAQRHGRTLGLLLIDADHFKRINDTFGHARGDEALCVLADTLRDLIRAEDLLGRYGGEEFVVLMPDVDLLGAAAAAERLRQAIGDQPRQRRLGYELRVSIGVAVSRQGEDLDALIRRADQALYAAKRAGRNRVAVADSETGISVLAGSGPEPVGAPHEFVS